jgi:hypothetical protein
MNDVVESGKPASENSEERVLLDSDIDESGDDLNASTESHSDHNYAHCDIRNEEMAPIPNTCTPEENGGQDEKFRRKYKKIVKRCVQLQRVNILKSI